MKVAVLGPLCKDRNIIAGKNYERPGGVTYYTGIALARLGAETLVFGTRGESYSYWPQNETAVLHRIPAEGTIEFINEYHSDDRNKRRQRAVIHRNTIMPDQLDHDLIRTADYLILGPLLHDNITWELVEHLAVYNRLVLAAQGLIRDVENEDIIWGKPERVLRLLPYCEYVAMDSQELRFISGHQSLDQGAEVLMNHGATKLIVTRGSRGSVLYLDGKRYNIRSFPPQRIVDPTGAGDSYLAGFIRALDLYGSPQQWGEFAAITATISLEASGAFNSSLDEVRRRLG